METGLMEYNVYKYTEPIHVQIANMLAYFCSEKFIRIYNLTIKFLTHDAFIQSKNRYLTLFKRSSIPVQEWYSTGAYLEDLAVAYKNNEIDWGYFYRQHFALLFNDIRKLSDREWVEAPCISSYNKYTSNEIDNQYGVNFYYRFKINSPIQKLVLQMVVNDLYEHYYPKEADYIPSKIHKEYMEKIRNGARLSYIDIDEKTVWVLAFFLYTYRANIVEDKFMFYYALNSVIPI